jgi:hypothetical protein
VHALTGRRLLTAGGSASLALAALHILIIVIGSRAYLYFGRADLAEAASGGSLYPPLVTLVITITLAVWGLYAYSGAGLLRRLPLLRIGLVTIACIYTLRGLVLVADVARWLAGKPYPPRQAIFSAAALGIGLCYALGTAAIVRHDPARTR